MKTTLKVTGLVVAGMVVVVGLALAALHTIVELDEYYCCRYDD